MFCPERLVQDKSKDQIVRQYFISPLMQLVRGFTKMAGKKLAKALNEFSINKEAEKCAV
jgi:Ran GTPase-activating protein (RanGAP) involved in mRNA processing and transport